MERNNRNVNNLSTNNMNKRSPHPQSPQPQPPQHDDLIKYIHEAWHKVSEPGPHGKPTYYSMKSEERHMKFQPFDLDSFWGRKVFENIQISRGHQ